MPELSYTALGTNNGSILNTLSIPGVSLATGDSLIVLLATDPTIVLGSESITWNGNALTEEVADTGAAIWALHNVTGDTADVVWSGDLLTTVAMSALSITPASGFLSFDQSTHGSGNDNKPRSGDSGFTLADTEFLVGSVGTGGPVTDSPGTWADPLVDGQRDGTNNLVGSNVTISEGYALVNNINVYNASKDGINTRAWGACLATYYQYTPTTYTQECDITATVTLGKVKQDRPLRRVVSNITISKVKQTAQRHSLTTALSLVRLRSVALRRTRVATTTPAVARSIQARRLVLGNVTSVLRRATTQTRASSMGVLPLANKRLPNIRNAVLSFTITLQKRTALASHAILLATNIIQRLTLKRRVVVLTSSNNVQRASNALRLLTLRIGPVVHKHTTKTRSAVASFLAAVQREVSGVRAIWRSTGQGIINRRNNGRSKLED